MHIGLGHKLGNPIRTTLHGPSTLPHFRRYIANALIGNVHGMRATLVEAARAGFHIDHNQAFLTPTGASLMRELRRKSPENWFCPEHRNCMFSNECHAAILIEALDAADAARFARTRRTGALVS